MAGISALFKVIYLGETSALNALTLWRDYNFSWKSTLLTGISGVVRHGGDSVSALKIPPLDPSPAGLKTPVGRRWTESAPWNNSKQQQLPNKYWEACKGGELWLQIRLPVQKSWRKTCRLLFLLFLSAANHKPILSSTSLFLLPTSFLFLYPHLIPSFLFILSLAALLPKEELSHGFPEPAVMLKL